jgi:NADH dehydrogenase (ubiquinone) 1 beta subcomplex subunit 8
VHQLHEQDEVLSMWGPDIPPLSPYKALAQFSIAVVGFVGFGFLVKEVFTPDVPAVRREYPYSGLVTELGGIEENKVRKIGLAPCFNKS